MAPTTERGSGIEIPKELREQIRIIDTAAAAIHQETAEQKRQAIIRAAAHHGFTVAELVQRGILAPEPQRNGAPT